MKTKKEQIIKILEKYKRLEYHILERDFPQIADDIMAILIEVPTEEEIYKAGEEYEKKYEEGMGVERIQDGWKNEDFENGAEWAIDEILKRNK